MAVNEIDFSLINEYYSNKSILITGVTGLVGKVLLYKILNSIKTINKVYILIREKNNQNVDERFSQLIARSKGLFDEIDVKCFGKIVLVNGNLTTIGMNLSENNKIEIINNVSVVFHCAADVTFVAKLREQILINVGGTKEIIDLCGQLDHFDAMVYVSTAYSSPLEKMVNECVNKSVKQPLDVLEIARNSIILMKASDYLGEYPNTYSFTKNLAENLIKNEFENNNLSVTIVRPGIVFNSIREPKRGWFNSVTSIVGIFVLLGYGLVKILNTKRNITADFIPVDIVANTCIVSAYGLNIQKEKELMVYNCNSSCINALRFGQFIEVFVKFTKEFPLFLSVRPIEVLTDDDLMSNAITRFIFETCFAKLIDIFLLIFGKKALATQKVRFYHSMMKAIQPYVGRQWYFTNNNMLLLSNSLSDIDRNIFNCDIQSIDWNDYIKNTFFSIKRLLLKENDEQMEKAKRNIK